MRLNKGFLITLATVLIPTLIQLIYIRFVSYEIDPSIYGDFSLLLTLVAGVSTILLTIPGAAFTRYFNSTGNQTNFINEFRTLLIPINILSLFIIIIYSYFMPQFEILTLILLFIFLLLQNNISLNRQIVLQKIERKKYFYVNLLEKSSKFAFPLLFFDFFQTLNSLVNGLLFGSIILTALIIHYNKIYTFQIIIDKRKLKIYFFYAYPIVFTAIFSWIIVFSDRYFINYFLDSHDVGIYTILAQVAAFTSMLNAIFSMYVNPIIYKLHAQNKYYAYQKLFSYLKIYALVIISLVIISIALPKEIYTLLITPEIIKNNYLYLSLLILIVGSMFSVFQNALSLFFTLEKKLHILGFFWFIAAIINLIGNTYVSDYGIMAAACSTACAYFIVMTANIIWIKNKYSYVVK